MRSGEDGAGMSICMRKKKRLAQRGRSGPDCKGAETIAVRWDDGSDPEVLSGVSGVSSR